MKRYIKLKKKSIGSVISVEPAINRSQQKENSSIIDTRHVCNVSRVRDWISTRANSRSFQVRMNTPTIYPNANSSVQTRGLKRAALAPGKKLSGDGNVEIFADILDVVHARHAFELELGAGIRVVLGNSGHLPGAA